MSDKKNKETLLTFKDVNDRLLMTKNVYGSFRVSNIKKINPEIDDLWVEINFPEINLLDKVELINYDSNLIRLTYHFDLNQLIDKQLSQDRFYKFDEETRRFEKDFMFILDTASLSIYWGGPDSEPDTKEDIEIVYYFDDEIGFMLIQKDSKMIGEFNNFTIDNIYDISVELSSIIERIISNTM